MRNRPLFKRGPIPGLVLCFVLSAACTDSLVEPTPCTHIPEGGCPEGSASDPCVDPTCAAVYSCNGDRTWTFVHACAVHDASAPDVEVADANVRDTSIDAPEGAYGGPGCIDLQQPDCPLGWALDCSSGCCGCVDLFVCENRGWVLRARCENGVIR